MFFLFVGVIGVLFFYKCGEVFKLVVVFSLYMENFSGEFWFID